MFETQAESTFEASIDPPATSERTALQPSLELPSEVPSEVAATLHEGSTNSHLKIWEPTDPQFTKAIADYYSVSRKTVQEWFQKIKEACPWFPESDLKLPDDRYTPMAVHLMGRYRTSGLPFKTWKAQIWEENAELVAAFQASQQSQPAADSNGDRPSHNNGIVPYERSGALNTLLNSRPKIGNTHAPDQNPLVLAIQQKVSDMTTTTLNVRQQLDQVRQMSADTQEAIQALRDLEVVERGQAMADRHYQLEQQAYTQRLQALGVEDVLGKSQAETAQPQST